jgi:hypothetical protein
LFQNLRAAFGLVYSKIEALDLKSKLSLNKALPFVCLIACQQAYARCHVDYIIHSYRTPPLSQGIWV